MSEVFRTVEGVRRSSPIPYSHAREKQPPSLAGVCSQDPTGSWQERTEEREGQEAASWLEEYMTLLWMVGRRRAALEMRQTCLPPAPAGRLRAAAA